MKKILVNFKKSEILGKEKRFPKQPQKNKLFKYRYITRIKSLVKEIVTFYYKIEEAKKNLGTTQKFRNFIIYSSNKSSSI